MEYELQDPGGSFGIPRVQDTYRIQLGTISMVGRKSVPLSTRVSSES
jgi:hypothetical protein